MIQNSPLRTTPAPEKTRIIEGELSKLGIYSSTILTQDNFYELLDRRIGGRTFDRGIAAQLYDRMTKDQYGRFQVSEFIKVYLEAEKVLLDKISQLEISITEYERQKSEVIAKLDAIKRDEITNPYGIMEGSKLYVTVYEFQYMTTSRPKNLYASLSCEQQAFRSQAIEATNIAVWNEPFEIDITTGLGDLNVAVMGYYSSSDAPEVIGEVRIPLAKLKDQQEHEEMYDLFDRNGHLLGGKLHLRLQWIYSKVKYLNDVARKWDDHIRMHLDDMTDSERDLKALYDLFPALLSAFPQIEKKKTFVPTAPYITHLHKTISPARDNFDIIQDEKSAFAQEVVLEWKDIKTWGWCSYYGSIALLVLSTFACFFRADFVDLVLGVIFLVHFNTRRMFRGTPDTVYYLFLGVLTALAIDVLWLIFLARGWNRILRGAEVSYNPSNFAIALKWFSLPVKAVLTLFYFKFSKYMRSGKLANINLHQMRYSVTQMKNY